MLETLKKDHDELIYKFKKGIWENKPHSLSGDPTSIYLKIKTESDNNLLEESIKKYKSDIEKLNTPLSTYVKSKFSSYSKMSEEYNKIRRLAIDQFTSILNIYTQIQNGKINGWEIKEYKDSVYWKYLYGKKYMNKLDRLRKIKSESEWSVYSNEFLSRVYGPQSQYLSDQF